MSLFYPRFNTMCRCISISISQNLDTGGNLRDFIYEIMRQYNVRYENYHTIGLASHKRSHESHRSRVISTRSIETAQDRHAYTSTFIVLYEIPCLFPAVAALSTFIFFMMPLWVMNSISREAIPRHTFPSFYPVTFIGARVSVQFTSNVIFPR